MQKALSSIFWDFYAFCYDGVRELKPYQDMLEEVLKELDLKPGMKVLDAGCGTGNLEALIAERYPDVEVVAVDFSPAMLKRAYKKTNSENIIFMEADLNQPLPFPDNHFDRVVSVNALHALSHYFSTLSELHRVLAYGGKAVLVALKENFHIPFIMRAHLEHINRGSQVSDRQWLSRKFLDWCKILYQTFGVSVTALRFFLIAFLNKIIDVKVRGFDEQILGRYFLENGWNTIKKYLIYGDQDLVFVAEKPIISVRIANGEDYLEEVFEIRHKVFVEENDLPADKERDKYDTDSRTTHFVVLDRDEVIGTFRLIRISDATEGFRGLYQLPFEFDFSRSLEFSRVALAPDKRGLSAFVEVVKYVLRYSIVYNYQYTCGTTRIELMKYFQKIGCMYDFISEPFFYYGKWSIVAFVASVEKNAKRFLE